MLAAPLTAKFLPVDQTTATTVPLVTTRFAAAPQAAEFAAVRCLQISMSVGAVVDQPAFNATSPVKNPAGVRDTAYRMRLFHASSPNPSASVGLKPMVLAGRKPLYVAVQVPPEPVAAAVAMLSAPLAGGGVSTAGHGRRPFTTA